MRKRRPRSARPYFAASAVLALAAVLLLHGYLSRDALARPIGPNIGVVVAAETLDRGTTVQPSALRMARLPRQYAPPGAITDMSKAAGRVLLAGLLPGEVVTETRLARVRAGPVASLVPRGLRAFAVPTSLAPGAVVPGDRVDVLATFGSGQPHTEMVANGAEVLLVLSSRRSHGEGGGIGGGGLDAEAVGVSAPTTLILLVSSGQEESLAYARAFGSVEVAIVPSE